jgi:hypothetical protein
MGKLSNGLHFSNIRLMKNTKTLYHRFRGKSRPKEKPLNVSAFKGLVSVTGWIPSHPQLCSTYLMEQIKYSILTYKRKAPRNRGLKYYLTLSTT